MWIVAAKLLPKEKALLGRAERVRISSMVKVTRTIEISEIGPVTISVNDLGHVEVREGECEFVLEMNSEEARKLGFLIIDAAQEAE